LPKIDVAIVEDDECLREAMRHFVQLLGYDAASFASAEDFLNSGSVGDTGCLLTDIDLPGMSGIELQGRLNLDGCGLPILFITGFPEPKTRERVLKDGALCYLSKPLQEQSLIAYLDQALKRPRPDAANNQSKAQ
jgi:FixJ family two-component response regulator